MTKHRWRAIAISLVTLSEVASAEVRAMTMKDVVKVAPENGTAAVGPYKPTWCDAVGEDGVAKGDFTNLVRHTTGPNVWDNRDHAIEAACREPDNPAFHAQVGMYMQRWVNMTGATPKQLAAYFELIANGKVEALSRATCAKLPVIEEGSDRLKFLRGKELEVLGCSTYGDPATPLHIAQTKTAPGDLWKYDRAEAPPSQILGIARLLGCVASETIAPYDIAAWAVCRLELPLLDATKLDAELKAGGFNQLGVLYAQQALATVKLRARRFEAAFQAALAKDPDIKTVLGAAERGWKQWVADYTANKSLVDAALAYEDKYEGVRKSMGKGCLASTAGIMKAVMAGKHGATTEEVMTAATSGIGPVALRHVASCFDADVEPQYGRNLAQLMVQMAVEWGPPARGPRTAAMVAMSKAAATIAADRTGFSYGPSEVGVEAPYAPFKRQLASIERQGQVASIKTEGEKVTITFKRVTFKEKEMSCVETGKIIMWSGDGTPIYARNCNYTGRIVTRDVTAEPFYTYRHFAGGITKGTFVKVIGGGTVQGSPMEGFPVEVWSGDGKKLIAVMGLEAN